MQKFKVNGLSVLKTEWKQIDEWTDKGGNCITSLANVLDNNNNNSDIQQTKSMTKAPFQDVNNDACKQKQAFRKLKSN